MQKWPEPEEAEAMCKAANEAGVINMVAFNYRRTPTVALAKKFIDEGRIGDVVNFRGTYLQGGADPDGPYLAFPKINRWIRRNWRHWNPCR